MLFTSHITPHTTLGNEGGNACTSSLEFATLKVRSLYISDLIAYRRERDYLSASLESEKLEGESRAKKSLALMEQLKVSHNCSILYCTERQPGEREAGGGEP